MKRFTLVALLAAMLFGVASSASATELKVKGNLDVYGLWSANLRDFNSDTADGDNYMTTQRFRSYFTYEASENLKAVLGLETNNIWGQGSASDWGTDGIDNLRVKHTFLDFTFPDSAINVKAGLQAVALPGIFGNPVFDDDAAALIVSAPVNDMFALAVGYSRGADKEDNYDKVGGSGKDDVDMAFLAVPITLDGLSATPYLAYAQIGAGVDDAPASAELLSNGTIKTTAADPGATDDSTAWVAGFNAALTVFDPLTFAADLIYGALERDGYESKGWYGALAASYKLDFLTATLFSTYATGADKDADKDSYLPTLAEGWELSPYLGGARAFSTGLSDGFGSDTVGVGNDGTGVFSAGLVLDNISFVDKLSHKLVAAYAKGTSDKEAGVAFDEEDSGWEMYMVNTYAIYENLAAINELGYFAANLEDADLDDSYFTTVGFAYKF